MYLCVRVLVLSLSTILIFDFGIVPTVWYFLFFIFLIWFRFRFMVVNATFNNISVTSWRPFLLMEKTTDWSQVTDKLYLLMLYRLHLTMKGDLTHNFSGDRHGLYKSNYHTITTTTAPSFY